MNKAELMQKFAAIVEEFERGRLWGVIEVQFGDGVPNLVRKTTNEKLCTRGDTRARERNF